MGELKALAADAQVLLPSASPAARREWEALRCRWPSEIEVRQGAITLSEDELAIMLSKVRRFCST